MPMYAPTTKETARVVLKIATNIQGKNPAGVTAVNTNPVIMGGVDDDNKIKGLVLNDDGAAKVTIVSGNEIIGAVLNHGDIPNIVTNTPLLANATFTQDTIDRQEQEIPIGSTRIWVNADQSGTLYLEESHNGTNWTTTATNVVSAGVQVIRDWTVLTRRYCRIRYVNGTTNQTSFKIQQYFIGVGVTPVRAEDGAMVTIGSKSDAAVIDPTASASIIALLKGIEKQLQGAGTGATPVSLDIGEATGGSKTTIIDTSKDWETDMFAGHNAKVTVAGIDYYRTVASNTADAITINALPGASASAIIGTPGTAEVTITVVAEGVGGNEYTAEVVEAPGDDDNLSASLTGLVLTVYLGKTGGVLDGAKNTATLVAAAIDQISEFTAEMTGSGGVVPVAEAVSFTGGIAVVTVTAGSEYQIMRKTHVQLTGSIPEYAWLEGAESPTPFESSKFAWGYKFNATTGEIIANGWTGTAWVEVV